MTARRPRGLGAILLSWLLLAAAPAAADGRAAPVEPDTAPEAGVCVESSGVCPFDAAVPARPSPTEASPHRSRVTLEFFWGVGCPHCEQARFFLEELRRERPGLTVEAVEVRNDPIGRQRFIDTLRRLGTRPSGVPTFVVGDRYLVGFTRGVSEPQLTELVDHAIERPSVPGEPGKDEVQTRWLGRLSASKLGLPLFTLALGLLDGFNPCAMWVLVFLLAMLAGQRDRRRMALSGATFVVVSGVVYFCFMAAWLSVFLVVGMSRALQLALGGIALGIGALNLKDFFAFRRGPSLSIPDAAKPGIYARVRRVLQEHRLAASLVGVAAIAVLVNFVELLCTAGLPAIYTSVLARQQLSSWGRLGYLGLYNLAYVADDAAMVTIGVVTLSRRRLAETTGRWLKLVSGAVMFGLGLLLLLRPEWLP